MQQDENGLPYFDPDQLDDILSEVSKLKADNEGSLGPYELITAAVKSNGPLKQAFTWKGKEAARMWVELQALTLLQKADQLAEETEEEKDVYDLLFSSSEGE